MFKGRNNGLAFFCYNSEHHEKYCEYSQQTAQPGNEIAVFHIKGNIRIEVDILFDSSGHPPPGLLYHIAALVNEG